MLNILNDEEDETKKSSKRINAKTRLVIALVLIISMLSIGLLLRSCNPIEAAAKNTVFDLATDSDAENGGINGKSKEEVEAELNQKVADGSINISMNVNPTFSSGKSKGNLLIVNDNVNNYPQVVEIYRNDTNELIYKSGGIPVGSKVEMAKLIVELNKGNYPCTAYFNAVNPDTHELVGKAAAKITVTIQN